MRLLSGILILVIVSVCGAWKLVPRPIRALAASAMVVIPALGVALDSPTIASAYGPVEEKAASKKQKVKVLETDLGIQYVVLKKGEGAFPNSGDFVAIQYIGFLPDGKVFDDTHEKKALSFTFGKKQVIPGLESVIEMLSAGSEVTTNIPAKYAYGAKGVCTTSGECLIPPNTDLKYFIRLKRVGAGYN
jgi:FKBP-type peptidyl-prolyl cis-trans isomerase